MIRLFLFFFCLTVSFVHAHQLTIPDQDVGLITLLRNQHIRLIVMRHGEAIHNLSHLMTSCKSPGIYLTERGIQQVKQTAAQLASEKIDKIYTSPVYRTLQTAHILGAELQVPYQKIKVDELLKEQYFGDYEGCTYHEYLAYFKDPEDVYISAAPRGEPGISVYGRTRRFLWEVCSAQHNKTILLITHGFNCCQISRCLTGAFDDIPRQAEYKIYDFHQ